MTSLAVLPLANMSADVDNEHFRDGLGEELLNALSKIDALKVAARTSAFSFKGKTVDVGTIARTLGVTSVLDGSIRRSGTRRRISVQLVNAADGYQVWSERYDREMRDVFEAGGGLGRLFLRVQDRAGIKGRCDCLSTRA